MHDYNKLQQKIDFNERTILSFQASIDGKNSLVQQRLLQKYEDSINEVSKNFDLIRKKQDDLINKFQRAVNDQSITINKEEKDIIELTGKISEYNNTLLLQKQELEDRNKNLEVIYKKLEEHKLTSTREY